MMARNYECDACEHVQLVGVIDNGLTGFADPDARCENCGAVGQFHFGPGAAESIRQMADALVVSLDLPPVDLSILDEGSPEMSQKRGVGRDALSDSRGGSPSMSATRIEFEATIVLDDHEIDAAGGLEQAVQNEIGPAGAALVRVTHIADVRSPSRGQA